MQALDADQIAFPDVHDMTAGSLPMGAVEAEATASVSAASEVATEDQDASAGLAQRPDTVPEKFWDSEAGIVRTEALLRSYLELERRLGRSVPKPEGEDDIEAINRLLGVLGRPAAPEGYQIVAPHPFVEPDAELNAVLHEAGFTQRQAQLVYELAAERLVPLLQEAADELAASRQIDRLQQHFGGAEAWRKTAAQIKAYAEANLPPETHDVLSGSYEGVLALYELMRKAEPDIVGQAGSGQLAATEDSLRELIRDPRYWRDRDPEIVQRVTAGYRNLYPS